MTKIALIGAGKMGISHLSILGAHPGVEVVGVSDTSKMVMDVFTKYTAFPCFTDYEEMLDQANPGAVVVAVPTKFHGTMVRNILEKGKHVFAEKPLCMTAEEGRGLVDLAARKKLVNQVGYHNKFLGTFREVKKIIEGGFLGELFHFEGSSYGPVVIRQNQGNWRADPREGGGCLMDYASHVIDLINYMFGPVTAVKGSLLKSFYSKSVEDAVYALLEVRPGLSGTLAVNWSDETYRKMSTSVTVQGSKGKIICDANEIKAYFKTAERLEGYDKGWNVKYLTELTTPVEFYLRGEEYSAQMDYFIQAVEGKVPNTLNTFQTAWETDRVIAMIRQNAAGSNHNQ